jgi:geranylgeranyl diphosphate synthase type I
LGAFGDEATTGKPVGDDLREGKPTPLLSVATANADEGQAAVLAMVGDASLTDEAVAAIQQVLTDTGAVAAAEAAIDALTTTALAAIVTADVTDEARAALVELAEFVAWRSA